MGWIDEEEQELEHQIYVETRCLTSQIENSGPLGLRRSTQDGNIYKVKLRGQSGRVGRGFVQV